MQVGGGEITPTTTQIDLQVTLIGAGCPDIHQVSWTLGTIPVTATPAGNFSVLIDTIALPFNAIYTFSTLTERWSRNVSSI